MQIMQSVQREIRNLALPGINPHSVVIHTVFTDNEETVLPSMPGVVIVPAGSESLDILASPTQSQAVGYPVGIAFFAVDKDHIGDFNEVEKHLDEIDRRFQWRETVRRRFHMQRLNGVNEVQTCSATMNTPIDEAKWLERGIYISALTLNFSARETRLTNA